ncbi:DUF3231 family protein [Gracilibacillus kekensis]|uniref:DUF3231 family protein n=1 Tax=Gracilibacillus kekensis TaxID=1027249 RepID=A0A1M7Q7W8_9BACI|nr:DUF3231 family protein [Gracilibacillus kekensis]SHN26334.1 Protein of unknown function [Gracilibacillus kekensis]
MTDRKIYLTSGEIASLWTAYMNESMLKCVLRVMLQHIKDSEINEVIQSAYDVSSNNLEQLQTIFEQDDYAIPSGFNESDINLDAPWLYTDTFCLNYIAHLSRVGMLGYSGSLSLTTRSDIRDYFTQVLNQSVSLFNHSSEVSLSKGITARHPYMEVPKEQDFVESKKYMSGLNPFNETRPLNAVEISHLYLNIMTNSIGVKLCLSFAQTSPTKEVQEFMLRGKEVSKKHIKIFADTLFDDEIEATRLPDLSVSDSTTQTFSDKLMMFHMSLMMTAGIGNYATAAATSQRNDLVLSYERLSLEVAKLAKSGAEIMIKNHWLEQPPGIKDKEKLARKK